MSTHTLRALDGAGAPATRSTGLEWRVATVTSIEQGRPWVSWEGRDAVPARVAWSGVPRGHSENLLGQSVMVALEGGNPLRPILTAVIRDDLAEATDGGALDQLELDLDQITLAARQQLTLRCGDASITLKADGQLVIKGTRVMSRASETNKVRGATVLIN